jgi:hypothetical protein
MRGSFVVVCPNLASLVLICGICRSAIQENENFLDRVRPSRRDLDASRRSAVETHALSGSCAYAEQFGEV